MAIKIGENDVKTLKVGDKQVKKVMLGGELVWQDFKGFTFSGNKDTYSQIRVIDALQVSDSSEYKKMWVIDQGVERLIWTHTGSVTLSITSFIATVIRFKEDSRDEIIRFLDSGKQLPNGSYTFKVELI